jgi:hypothetical protein
MPYLFKVTGHTFEQSCGYMPAEHTDREIVVEFENWEANRVTLENFVSWYWGIDLQQQP